jgi:hypothetical protein
MMFTGFIFHLAVLFCLVSVSLVSAAPPSLPQQFTVTLSFTSLNGNYTFSGQQFYDGVNQLFRVDMNSNNISRVEMLWNLQIQRFYNIDRTMRNCTVYNATTYSPPNAFNPIGNSQQLFTPEEIFRFNASLFIYNVTERVRGIWADQYYYNATNDSFGRGNFTGIRTIWFASAGWTFRGQNVSQIPVRSMNVGTFTFINSTTGQVQTVNVNSMVDYTDFTYGAPEDVFQVPYYCVDTLNPVPLPSFMTNSYSASMEVTYRNTKQIVYINEYCDSSNQMMRLDYLSNGQSNSTIVLGTKKQVFQVTGSNSCVKQPLTTEYDDAVGILSVAELFDFNTSTISNLVYLGQQVVRGINCDHWTAQQVLDDGNTYQVDHFFSAEPFGVDSSDSDVIPMRVIIVGQNPNGNVVNMSIDVLNYATINPDPDIFMPPYFCPGYIIYAPIKAYHAAGVGFLCLFIGIAFGLAIGALSVYLACVKQVCARFSSKGGNISGGFRGKEMTDMENDD